MLLYYTFLNGQETLYQIAKIVSIIVIILLAITFAILFGLYAFYKEKNIKFGHEDNLITKDIEHKYQNVIIEITRENLIIVDEETENVSSSTLLESKEDLSFDSNNDINIEDNNLINNNDNNEIEEDINNTINVLHHLSIDNDEDNINIKYYNQEPKSIHNAILKTNRRNKKINFALNIIFGIFYIFIATTFIIALSFNINNEALFIGDTHLITISTASMEEVHKNNTYIEENKLNDQITQYSLIAIKKIKILVI